MPRNDTRERLMKRVSIGKASRNNLGKIERERKCLVKRGEPSFGDLKAVRCHV